MRKAIAIDFDGCLCTNAYPEIGEPNWPVIRRAQAEQRAGAGLILWTCREDQLLLDAIAACGGWGLTFDAVNESLPDWIEEFGTRPRGEEKPDMLALCPFCGGPAKWGREKREDAVFIYCESCGCSTKSVPRFVKDGNGFKNQPHELIARRLWNARCQR